MDFDELRQILELVREHELTEFELERGEVKLRLKKSGPVMMAPMVPAMPAAPAMPAPALPGAPAAAPVAA
ncbi:MAG: acetyl-CoA carboxylase, biotin carboxyl carrier protein, partial [Acidobacteriota bacterium]|nr:acetyl-CoA carboxylase, biotin carboxyl carrier protein [Acidobacteriota bacterium]